uniref:Uncharacterized protein n=1 Tax=Cyanoderma ruficeps TaxID=181631 RepID=A0A8C3R791_9PASS
MVIVIKIDVLVRKFESLKHCGASKTLHLLGVKLIPVWESGPAQLNSSKIPFNWYKALWWSRSESLQWRGSSESSGEQCKRKLKGFENRGKQKGNNH